MSILKNYFEHQEDRNDFFIALVVILFFGAGILGYLFKTSQQEVTLANTDLSGQETIAASDKTESESNLAPIPLHQSIKRQQNEWVSQLEEKGVSNTIALASFSEDSASLDLDTVDHVLATEVMEPVLASDSIDQSSLDTSNIKTMLRDSNEMNTLVDTVTLVEAVDSLETSLNTIAPDTETSEKAAIEERSEGGLIEGECAIFLGAFKSKTNAERLVAKLNENPSYTVFSNYERGYQVVGVKVSCEKQIAREILQEIRGKYSKDAWFAPIKSEE